MSPIRAENRARYPADWPAISRRIRFERAAGRCECDGRCGSKHCLPAQIPWTFRRCFSHDGEAHPATFSRVVLTVAHLDHTPEHSTDDNLLAMCQACHLAYDREHHAATRAATLAARHERSLNAGTVRPMG